MIAGLVNSVLNDPAPSPQRATIQLALLPVEDDPAARIAELEKALAQAGAEYDKLCDKCMKWEIQVLAANRQVRLLQAQIAYLHERYVPRAVLDVLEKGVLDRRRT